MAEPIKPKIIVIVGTTASGKSSLAVTLASKFNGEVISADSRQVYRKLDIGTAKLTKAEMAGVPHHLIDICNIDQTYTAVDFRNDAQQAITGISERGGTPIIAGGTFFYIDRLLNRISIPEVPPNPLLRQELETKSTEALYQDLLKLDPQRAATIDIHNKRRLVRAIEIAMAIGSVPPSVQEESPYNALILGIKNSKEELLKKFRARAEAWLAEGFIDEVSSLIREGISKERLNELGFEYQLGMQLVEQTISKTDFIEVFVQKNWQYAKRQLTWLKRDTAINWVYLSERAEIDMVVEQFLIN